jgi:flagellar protein FlbD
MILVTRMNKETYYLNEDKIEFIEQVPDTIITLETGKKLVVAESPAIIIERIREEKSIVIKRQFSDGYVPHQRPDPLRAPQ